VAEKRAMVLRWQSTALWISPPPGPAHVWSPRSVLLVGTWVDPPRGKPGTPAAFSLRFSRHLVLNGESTPICGPKLTAFRIASPERAYPPPC
jgi:hypothetical protein